MNACRWNGAEAFLDCNTAKSAQATYKVSFSVFSVPRSTHQGCYIFRVFRIQTCSRAQMFLGWHAPENVKRFCTGDAQQEATPATDAAAPDGNPEGQVALGMQQWLQVCALKPHMHVSLVDTDLEAEVTPSAEFMERVAAEQVTCQTVQQRSRWNSWR